MKIGSLALTVVALSAAPPPNCGIRSALATDFCVELTAAEFNHRLERRGDENACAGSNSLDIKGVARERARDNANNAIASRCLDITTDIGKQACTRVNLVASTSPNNAWADSPPVPKPDASKVKYIGHGIGDGAAGVNLCAMAHDLRLRTRNVVDGHCPHDTGLLPHRTFVTARAWARCAVICGTP